MRQPRERSGLRSCWPSRNASSTGTGRSPTSDSGGDDELQQGIRFNLFQPAAGGRPATAGRASPPRALRARARGPLLLGRGDLRPPYFIYTHPDIARQLLLFRCRTLDKARDRARELGHRGALFPWRTIAGEETSPYFPAGNRPIPHRTADIGVRLGSTVSATGDHHPARRRRRADIRDRTVLAFPG